MRVCETGKLSQTEGSISVKQECAKRDSARLEKGKVYHGNKDLSVNLESSV